MKPFAKAKNGMQNIADILFLVVSGYDDEFLHWQEDECTILSFRGLLKLINGKNPDQFFLSSIVRVNISVSFCLVCCGKSPFIIQS